jgi:hypothetical protein
MAGLTEAFNGFKFFKIFRQRNLFSIYTEWLNLKQQYILPVLSLEATRGGLYYKLFTAVKYWGLVC